MGEPSTSEISDAFRQTRYEGQEEDNKSGNQGEVVRQIEGLLGGKKSRQEVSLVSSIPCKSFSVLISSRTHHFSENLSQIHSDLIRYLHLGFPRFFGDLPSGSHKRGVFCDTLAKPLSRAEDQVRKR
jgi:hypothetical protein